LLEKTPLIFEGGRCLTLELRRAPTRGENLKGTRKLTDRGERSEEFLKNLKTGGLCEERSKKWIKRKPVECSRIKIPAAPGTILKGFVWAEKRKRKKGRVKRFQTTNP